MRKIFPAVAAGVAMLTLAGGTFGYAVLGKDVTLAVDGSSRQLGTTAATVGQVLQAQGIEVGRHDVVAPSPDTELTDGTVIAVRYGRPVTVTVDGKPHIFWTTATTVAQALESRQIEVDGDDHVSTSRSSGIGREGMAFAVSTRKTVTVKKKSKVDFATRYKDSDEHDRGETEVERHGAAGVRTTTYTEVWLGGKLSSRTKTVSEVTTKPRAELVLRGTRRIRSVLDGGEPAQVGDGGGRRSEVFVTGYTYWDNSPPGSAQIAQPQIHDRAGGVGTWNDPITVAVGAGRFDFGTRFYLPELKKYLIVEDLCGACSDGRGGGAYTLDVWIDGSDLSSAGAASCASRVTGLQPAIEDPRSNLPVASGSVC